MADDVRAVFEAVIPASMVEESRYKLLYEFVTYLNIQKHRKSFPWENSQDELQTQLKESILKETEAMIRQGSQSATELRLFMQRQDDD